MSQQYEPTSGKYRSIIQVVSAQNYINSFSGTATVKRNGAGTYLDNVMSVKADWNKDNAIALTSSSFSNGTESALQHLDNPSFEISDRLTIIKNTGEHAWDIRVSGGWKHRPQSLSVELDKNESEQDAHRLQNYTTDNVKALFFTSQSIRIKRVWLHAGVFSDLNIEQIRSDLDGINFAEGYPTLNDFLYGNLVTGIQPMMSYSLSRFNLEFTLPIAYNRQWIYNRTNQSNSEGWNYASVMPNLHMTYFLGRNWLSLDANYNRMVDNSQRAAKGIVMTDYLSFRRSEIERAIIDDMLSASIAYRFSNPFRQFFGNAKVSWTQFRHNNITGYDYDGLSTVSQTLPIHNISNIYNIETSINKGLSFWDSTIKLSGVASLNDGNTLIGGSMFAFTTKSWSGSALVSMTPARCLGAALAFVYGESRSVTDNASILSPRIRQWTGRADINIYPFSYLTLNLSIENNYTNLTDTDRHVWFGDAKVKYRRGRFDWELSFNNIFNRRVFTKVNYTAMNIYTNTYILRERNFMLKVRIKIL